MVFAKPFKLARVEGTEWPLFPAELLEGQHKWRHEAVQENADPIPHC
jgi:hypothetical protein